MHVRAHVCACVSVCVHVSMCVCVCMRVCVLTVLCRQSRGHCQQTAVCAWGEPGAPAWLALSCPLLGLAGGCSGPARQRWEVRGAYSLATAAVRCSWRLGPGGRRSTYPAVLRASWTRKNCPARLRNTAPFHQKAACVGGPGSSAFRAPRPRPESSPTPPGPPWVRPRAPLVPEQPAVRAPG